MVPFYKFPVLTDAGVVGLALTMLTIVGSSNAVNLTDGLDGLAIGCTLIVSFVFLVLTYLAGNKNSLGLSADSPCRGRRGADGVLRVNDRRRARASFGSIAIPRRSSWVTPVPWRWEERWASLRS